MRVVELFAGVGGFRLGLERNGHEVVWSNEWDKYACDTYDKNFGGKIDRRDITTIDATDVPAHDLICGGFPCQAFSVAGKRRGFEETRGTLFFEIMRITRHHRTKYLFLENVKGLLSHDHGRTFKTIIETLDELGYDCQWQVLNSKDFGVPQNRERIFIIGHLRTEPRPQVFPISDSTNSPKGARQASSDIARTLTASLGGVDRNKQFVVERAPLRFLTRNQKNVTGDYSFTVDTTNTSGVKVNGAIRKLTPMECERLQGFPDGWTSGVSDSQRYKQMGNAVTVNVIEAIASLLPKNRP